MMERQSLIFEHFTLAFPHKNTKEEEDDDLASNQAYTPHKDSKLLLSNDKSDGRAQNEDNQNEADIKRKLKKMCYKPNRQKIEFYNQKTDMSVFTMIRNMARQSIKNCGAETCGKPFLAHTDYWYHGNGCIEMKLKLMDDTQKLQTTAIQKQLDQP